MVAMRTLILGIATAFAVSVTVIGISIYAINKRKDKTTSSDSLSNTTNNSTIAADDSTMTNMMNNSIIPVSVETTMSSRVNISSSTSATTIGTMSSVDTNNISAVTTKSILVSTTQSILTNTTSTTLINTTARILGNGTSIGSSTITSNATFSITGGTSIAAITNSLISTTSMPLMSTIRNTTFNVSTVAPINTISSVSANLTSMPLLNTTSNILFIITNSTTIGSTMGITGNTSTIPSIITTNSASTNVTNMSFMATASGTLANVTSNASVATTVSTSPNSTNNLSVYTTSSVSNNSTSAVTILIANATSTTVSTTSTGSATTGVNCQLAFMPMVSYPTSVDFGPFALATADLNNDSYLDIVTANPDNSSISVFLGNGNGTFQPQTTFYTGNMTAPYAIAVGDFNRDKQLDTVVVNIYGGNIFVLLGNGDGTFTAQKSISTGTNSYPAAISVGYFNNDSILDVAVANSGTNRIGVFIGNGNGTFQTQKTFSSGSGSEPLGVAVGDFNRDGYSDLVSANAGTNKVGIFLGYGNGSFRTQTTYSCGIAPSAIDVGDFNGDNNLDIAVVNSGSNSTSILLGYGNGTFATQITYPIPFSDLTYFIAIVDINKDGRRDIVIPNYIDDDISIMLGNGDGSFQAQRTFPTGYDSSPNALVITDFNNDNRSDIVVANYNSNEIGIFLGTC